VGVWAQGSCGGHLKSGLSWLFRLTFSQVVIRPAGFGRGFGVGPSVQAKAGHGWAGAILPGHVGVDVNFRVRFFLHHGLTNLGVPEINGVAGSGRSDGIASGE
jgi:hypothetical protein